MSKDLILIGLIIFSFGSCISPIDVEDFGYDNLLVVEATITDQNTPQTIRLTRTQKLTETTAASETGAQVWLEDEGNNQTMFNETAPGVYKTLGNFGANPGVSYTLHILTSSGKSYVSQAVQMTSTPEIDSIYAEFELDPQPENQYGGYFRFFLDSRNNPEKHPYFRWTWNSTFELEVPTPARWKWLGGNEFITIEWGGVNNHLQVQHCWKSDSSTLINIEELLNESKEVLHLPIHTIHSGTRVMQIGYSLEVKQYAISKAAYDYWNLIAETTQQQGLLSDKQVGTIRGNMRNTSDASEIVLGYFDVVQERAVRRYFDPYDFTSKGFRRGQVYFVDCDDTAVMSSAVDEIGEFMEEHGEAWVLGYFITSPSTAVYLRKRCADCTLYGVNTKPAFWK